MFNRRTHAELRTVNGIVKKAVRQTRPPNQVTPGNAAGVVTSSTNARRPYDIPFGTDPETGARRVPFVFGIHGTADKDAFFPVGFPTKNYLK